MLHVIVFSCRVSEVSLWGSDIFISCVFLGWFIRYCLSVGIIFCAIQLLMSECECDTYIKLVSRVAQSV
jgi:hypothetical protein